MAYLVFDVETTGIPKDYKGRMADVDNWPRVIQLACASFSSDGKPLMQYCQLIKPDGWTIPKEKFWIDNGYSTERNEAEGVPITHALDALVNNIILCDYLVAHNIAFDYPVVGAEMIRAGVKADRKLKQLCTVQSSIELCKLPGKYGFKYPKLIELHQHLFNKPFDGAHDAMADIKATARCFFELKNRNIIKLV